MQATDSAELLSVVSDVLNSTSANYSSLFSFMQLVMGSAFGLFTLNVIWNKFWSNKKIHDLINQKFEKFEKKHDKIIDKKSEELSDQIEKKVLSKFENKFKTLECDLNRSYAIMMEESSKEIALDYWFSALEIAMEIDSQYEIGRSIHAIENLISQLHGNTYSNQLSFNHERMRKIIEKVPEYLYQETDIILGEIKRIQKEIEKESA